MRRVVFLFPIFMLLLALCACDVSKMQSLEEFSRPYSGVYTCEELTLGGEDMLGQFDRLELELDYSGSFKISYETAAGQRGEYSGKYTVSPEGDEIKLRLRRGLVAAARTFSFGEGTVHIDTNLDGRFLHAAFRLP